MSANMLSQQVLWHKTAHREIFSLHLINYAFEVVKVQRKLKAVPEAEASVG